MLTVAGLPTDVLKYHIIPQLPLISCIRFLSTCKNLWQLGQNINNLQEEIEFWKRKIRRREIEIAHSLAIEKNELEIAKLLEPSCKFWCNSIYAAVRARNLELMIYYSNKLKPRARPSDICMMMAAELGYKDFVQYLMQQLQTFTAEISVLYGASKGGHLDLITMFPHVRRWSSLLSNACKGGHKHVVDFYLDHNTPIAEGILFEAAVGGNKDIVDIFIAKGHRDWNLGLRGAAIAGHKHLIEFFVKAGATNLEEIEKINAWRERRDKFMWEYARMKM